jgi:hypothetical protein
VFLALPPLIVKDGMRHSWDRAGKHAALNDSQIYFVIPLWVDEMESSLLVLAIAFQTFIFICTGK